MLDKMNNEIQVSSMEGAVSAAVVPDKPAAATTAAVPTFNAEQLEALKAVALRQNVFISGPGGTGKSFLIKYIKENAPPGCKVAVTALTGCAAILLGCGAKTLHSWAGIGLGKESTQDLVAKIVKSNKYNPSPYKSWTKTDVLVIDEISMMSAELFDKLNAIAKTLRKSLAPFGGLQVIALGDFFQLPPVVRDLKPTDAAAAAHFAFNARGWVETFPRTVQLREVIRQADPVFQEMLNSFRVGEVREDHVDLLKTRMNLDWDGLEIKPTLLFPCRAEVDRINAANLSAIEGATYTFETKFDYKPGTDRRAINNASAPENKPLIDRFDADAPYNTTETLAVGAQVMLIYNRDPKAGLVNGSRGVVTDFVKDDDTDELIPIVKFKNGMHIAIGRHVWEMEQFPGVCRLQIPLRLAYACTIHKSQGASLDCALIDCGPSVWEWGQAYVALSRVRSLDGLYMFAFDRRSVKAHPVVKEYYRTLASVCASLKE
jgi:ATP-dependent DNA helicase PIF1